MKKNKMNKKWRISLIGIGLFFILAGIFAGCQDTNETEINRNLTPGNGYLVLKLTDAPFPAELVAEANITIDRIQLLSHLEVDDSEEELEEQENDESIATKIEFEFEEPVTFNLLELSNGATTILAENEVPVGFYDEIRLHVIETSLVLTDDTEFDLKIPGGSTSGLKIKLHPSLQIEENGYAEVLLDIDVSRSFVVRGNFAKGKVNGFIFKPVIRAVVNMHTEAGEVAGKVSDGTGAWLQNALVTLKSGDDVITTALTDAEGYYAMIGIEPGEYTLVCEKEDYETAGATITIIAGTATEQNFVLTADSSDPGNDDEF